MVWKKSLVQKTIYLFFQVLSKNPFIGLPTEQLLQVLKQAITLGAEFAENAERGWGLVAYFLYFYISLCPTCCIS